VRRHWFGAPIVSPLEPYSMFPREQSSLVEISETSPELFSLFAQWLYTGELYHCESNNRVTVICITDLLRLYAFAHEQKVPLLRDDVMDEVIGNSFSNNEGITQYMVELALTIIPPETLLFKWMAYTWVRRQTLLRFHGSRRRRRPTALL
jgi:hypothetical protein